MPITITENGPDLLLTNTKTNQHLYLPHPTWSDLFRAIWSFDRFAEIGDTDITGPKVGIFDYHPKIDEHIITFYPDMGTSDGWIATHVGTRYAHNVTVIEHPNGTVFMIRRDLKRWTNTNQPQPGTFFEQLQALSGPEETNLEWSSDNPDDKGDINTIDVNPYDDGKTMIDVFINPYGEGTTEIALHYEYWGQSMWVFVAGSQAQSFLCVDPVVRSRPEGTGRHRRVGGVLREARGRRGRKGGH